MSEVSCPGCAQRYASAAELADDLRRFLNGQPIKARPVRRGERLLMWCRRRPVAAAQAGLGLALLAALTLLLALDRSRDSVAGKPPAAQPPSFAWDFEAGMPSHSIHQGTEFTHANQFGMPPYTDSLLLRFRMGGFSMLQIPVTLPDDARAPAGQPGGRWLLEVYHRNTTANKDGTGPDYSPASVSLNGQKVWEGNPDGPEQAQVPGGVRWKHLERDVSDLVRPGENVVRWDHLSGARTNYWLKSFRIFWEPPSP